VRGPENALAQCQDLLGALRVQVYDRLGVRLTERGESFYHPFIDGVVRELRKKAICIESDGATVVFVEGCTAPLIAVKSDGGYERSSGLFVLLRSALLGGKRSCSGTGMTRLTWRRFTTGCAEKTPIGLCTDRQHTLARTLRAWGADASVKR
jgi:hypothetical protein